MTVNTMQENLCLHGNIINGCAWINCGQKNQTGDTKPTIVSRSWVRTQVVSHKYWDFHPTQTQLSKLIEVSIISHTVMELRVVHGSSGKRTDGISGDV